MAAVRSTLHDSSHESDTETVISQGPEAGDASTDSLVDSESIVRPLAWDVRPSALTQVGFVALYLINVRDVFTHRACVMKVPPAFLRGAYRSAMRLALQEIISGMESDNQVRITRGWNLFILLSRMLLFKPPTGGKVAKNKFLGQFTKFAQGQWLELLCASAEASKSAADIRARRSRTRMDPMDQRVQRAEALLSMGEISAARHALEGSPVAPGSEETCNALTDASRRPPEPRDTIPEDILQIEPVRIRVGQRGFFFCKICEKFAAGLRVVLQECAQNICVRCWTTLRTATSSMKSHRLSPGPRSPTKFEGNQSGSIDGPRETQWRGPRHRCGRRCAPSDRQDHVRPDDDTV